MENKGRLGEERKVERRVMRLRGGRCGMKEGDEGEGPKD